LAGVDVAILVGGRGTRLGELAGGRPKPLVPVLGRPFLFYVLDLLALRGARSVVLCSGYRADVVAATVGDRWLGMPVAHSVETEPLGTAGALVQARPQLRSETIVVLNGDTWLEPDWRALLQAARAGAGALAAVEMADAARFGRIEFDAAGVVTGFVEKGQGAAAGFINGGVYAFSQAALLGLAAGPSSLEREVLPRWVAEGALRAVPTRSAFLDIGVPESLGRAGEFFTALGVAPHSMFPDRPALERALPRLGACAFVVDDGGRVILERRSDCGWWCCPGGRIEAGETLAQAAHREVREETGLEMRIERFVGIFSDPMRRTVRYPDNGDLRQLIDVAVLGRLAGGELRASGESIELRWFAPGEVPLNTCPPVTEPFRAAFLGDAGLLR
jgi:dTDP-glucose pyrophosphorylase/ADP-ribose pyrophosphatase YjhB (NUDIX family)